MRAILVTIFCTFIVPSIGIYYGKKNNETFSLYASIFLFIIGIWYLLLRAIGKFLEYNYTNFALASLIYFSFVLLVRTITVKCGLGTPNNKHPNDIS